MRGKVAISLCPEPSVGGRGRPGRVLAKEANFQWFPSRMCSGFGCRQHMGVDVQGPLAHTCCQVRAAASTVAEERTKVRTQVTACELGTCGNVGGTGARRGRAAKPRAPPWAPACLAWPPWHAVCLLVIVEFDRSSQARNLGQSVPLCG